MYCVKNRNTLDTVASLYMVYVGASTNRTLTGQGFGTKMVGLRCALDGIRFARASHDEIGPYIAHYEIEPYQLGRRAVVVVRRPEGAEERIPMTVDVNMVASGWSENSLGRGYPTIREMVLDAADEDRDFVIDQCPDIDFSPPGWTYTFVDETQDLQYLMRAPDYYFRRMRDTDVTWITREVGIAPCSTRNETRVFVTAGDDPVVAYVAWSSGDPGPTPAFDYIMRESADTKWTALPKRLVENIDHVKDVIVNALANYAEPQVLAATMRSAAGHGWESNFRWPSYSWQWNSRLLADAVRVYADGKPLHYTKDDSTFDLARERGIDLAIGPKWLYEAARTVNYETGMKSLGLRDHGEIRILNSMDALDRDVLNSALAMLERRFPHVNWNSHTYRAIEADRTLGIHIDRDGQEDTIGILFVGHASTKQVAETIIHEQTHHYRDDRNSTKVSTHDLGFANSMAEMLLGE